MTISDFATRNRRREKSLAFDVGFFLFLWDMYIRNYLPEVVTVDVSPGLPPDAIPVTVHASWHRRAIEVILQHETFQLVEDGEETPLLVFPGRFVAAITRVEFIKRMMMKNLTGAELMEIYNHLEEEFSNHE